MQAAVEDTTNKVNGTLCGGCQRLPLWTHLSHIEEAGDKAVRGMLTYD